MKNQELILRNCPYNRTKKKIFKNAIREFINKELIDIPIKLIIDFNGPKKAGKTTYYQGLMDLYNLDTFECNISLNYFFEFDNINNSEDCLWGIFHELIHVKQLYTKELIISKDGEFVLFRDQLFKKLPFRIKEFARLFDVDRCAATKYHMECIPWEKDPYAYSDQYTSVVSH
jgi:hypothetical protein